MSGSLHIRPAEPADAGLIFALVVELAEYERAAEQVLGTPQMLADALFGTDPAAEALIAEAGAEPVGFALFYRTFSTWESRAGIWLEDLYVRPAHRRGGVGRALLAEVAAIAVRRGCGRLEWSALDWNTPALEFYAGLGARQLGNWIIHRLDGDRLASFATASRGGGRAPDG